MKKKLFLFFLPAVILLSISWQIVRKANQVEKEEPMFKTNQKIISLSQPATSSSFSLEKAIASRRSRREYSKTPLTLKQISQILWAAQGITDQEKELRSAPSAGALYPLEIYLLTGEKGVEELESGVYHFQAENFQLKKVLTADLRHDLSRAALNQSVVNQAPATIIITALYQRTTEKYGQRGEQYVHLEAGHVGQNIYLQAEALGLGTVVIGAFNDQQLKELLQLDQEQPLYLMPIGNRQETEKQKKE